MPVSQMTKEVERGQKIVKVAQLDCAIKGLHPGCLALGSALTCLLFRDQDV